MLSLLLLTLKRLLKAYATHFCGVTFSHTKTAILLRKE